MRAIITSIQGCYFKKWYLFYTLTTCAVVLCLNITNPKLTPGHKAKGTTSSSSSPQTSITMLSSEVMGGPHFLMGRAQNGRWCNKCLSPNKDMVAFRVKHGSIKRQRRQEEGEGGRGKVKKKKKEAAPDSQWTQQLVPPIRGCWRGCDSSQWDSVLGQGSASGYDQLFKSLFWLSCPFSTMNARCKAPADALNVVTDYSWLTNRRAGTAPINPG